MAQLSENLVLKHAEDMLREARSINNNNLERAFYHAHQLMLYLAECIQRLERGS